MKTVWCGREDSNFHGLSATTTSTLRVYQFRHDRTSRRAPVNRGTWQARALSKAPQCHASALAWRQQNFTGRSGCVDPPGRSVRLPAYVGDFRTLLGTSTQSLRRLLTVPRRGLQLCACRRGDFPARRRSGPGYRGAARSGPGAPIAGLRAARSWIWCRSKAKYSAPLGSCAPIRRVWRGNRAAGRPAPAASRPAAGPAPSAAGPK
jgi:hypothetical protein